MLKPMRIISELVIVLIMLMQVIQLPSDGLMIN